MKFLITTIASGELYLNFVPIYVYSIKKAYPIYDIKIYTNNKIPTNIKKLLIELGYEDCLIEKDFGNIENNIRNIKALRWLYKYKDVKDFDFVFSGDIDFFIVKENPTLLKHHLNFCESQSLPYSNRVRANSYRLTGLHFYKVDEYYSKCENTIEEYYNRLIKKDYSIFKHPKSTLDIYYGDEELLYRIVEDSGLGFPKKVKEKRLHHGIHLKRKYKPDFLEKEKELVLYKDALFNAYNQDQVFKEILSKISNDARKYVDLCYNKLKERK